MPKPQHFIAVSFAAGILLTDQIHRLSILSTPSIKHHSHNVDLEFIPLELLRALSRNHTTMGDNAVDKSNLRIPNNRKSERIKKRFDPQKKFPWSLPPVPPILKSSKQFMSEINALKRRHNITLPWETSSQLPLPIISYNLPKSATLTTKEFFSCGDFASSHTYLPYSQIRIGDCMRDNYVANRDPFYGCSYHSKQKKSVEFYSDIGTQIGIDGRACWYNSLHNGGLEHVAKFHPNATIFMVPRNASSWYKSVKKWGNGRILKGWVKRCGFAGSIGDYSQEDWENFYNAHTEKIRQFALTNLHMTYVEVELESNDTAEAMEYYTGIDKSCLQHCYPGKPPEDVDKKTWTKCQPNNATS